jgi:hypothetical protein
MMPPPIAVVIQMGVQVQTSSDVARLMVMILSGQVNPASNIAVEDRVKVPASESIVK